MQDYLVIKIGGKPASNIDTLDLLLSDLGTLMARGLAPILVHGGGADVTELSRKLGLEPVFVQGKRLTSPEEMNIVDMGLAGLVNTRLLRRALACGIMSLGISGVDSGFFLAESMDGNQNNRTGSITKVNTKIAKDLCSLGYLPIVSSVSSSESDFSGLNINADDAAMAIAIALKAKALIFLSDIPGILDKGTVMNRVDRIITETAINSGVISGGMIPKVHGALDAVDNGVGAVIIGGYEKAGDLQSFIEQKSGTSILGKGHKHARL